ncbi:MAG: ion transporter [Leptonema sp. (in: Bacteria)]|nr:ion transporter [Leptonema sp. (in: bacteria)]
MIQPLIFLRKLPTSPIFNLFSLIGVISITMSIFIESFMALPLSTRASLTIFSNILFIFFVFESAVRITRFQSIHTYFSSHIFLLDIFSLLPPLIFIVIGRNEPLPGAILLKGSQLLRFIPLYQFFSREKSLGLRPVGSQVEFRLLGSAALLLYLFLMIGGIIVSSIHYRLSQEERGSLIIRVKYYLENQGLDGIQDLFPDQILKLEKKTPGEAYEINFVDPVYIQTHMLQQQDFLYIEGKTPDEAVWISFFNLNQRQLQFEAWILAIGICMIAALAFVLHRYFRDRILSPIEKSKRVLELRSMGEEIETTEIPNNIQNEITELIQQIDRFYAATKERADN